MLSEMQFGSYQVLIIKGSSEKLVFSLSGIGNVNAETMSYEFKKTLSDLALDYHKIFIKDLSRSWFNSENGWSELVNFLKEYISNFDIKNIRMLGLSMGGFGAIVLSKYISINKVLAFSIRESISKGKSFDKRNVSFINGNTEFIHDCINDMMSEGTEYNLVFSIDDLNDSLHASSFDSQRANVYYFRGDHNIPKTLGLFNLNKKLIDDFLNDNFHPENFFFYKPPSIVFDIARMFFENRKLIENENLKSIPLRFFPNFMMDSLAKNLLEKGIKSYPTHTFYTSNVSTGLVNFLGNGWAKPEKWGIWGVGEQHSLNIFVADVNVYGKVKINITLRIFSGAKIPLQRIIVNNNGENLFSIKSNKKDKVISFSVITKNFSNHIVMITPDAVSPASLGLNKDERKISIGIKEIIVIPAVL